MCEAFGAEAKGLSLRVRGEEGKRQREKTEGKQEEGGRREGRKEGRREG
jgi:hypothetical protein